MLLDRILFKIARWKIFANYSINFYPQKRSMTSLKLIMTTIAIFIKSIFSRSLFREREVERSWHLRSPQFFPYIFFRRFLLCRILRVHGWIAIEVEKTFNVKIYETRNGQLFKQEQFKILRQFSMLNAIYTYFLFCYLIQ